MHGPAHNTSPQWPPKDMSKTVPMNVALSGNRVFVDVIKLGSQDEEWSCKARSAKGFRKPPEARRKACVCVDCQGVCIGEVAEGRVNRTY